MKENELCDPHPMEIPLQPLPWNMENPPRINGRMKAWANHRDVSVQNKYPKIYNGNGIPAAY